MLNPLGSIPLNPVSLAGSVVTTVTGVVDRIASGSVAGTPNASAPAKSFQQTLQNAGVQASPERTLASMQDRLNQWLKESSFADDLPDQLQWSKDGRLQVIGDHPAAASLEAALANDAGLQESLQKIASAGDIRPPQRLVLTSAAKTANIGEARPDASYSDPTARPGGYANW